MRDSFGGEMPRAVCFDLYGTLVDISIDTKNPRLWEAFSAEVAEHGFAAEGAKLHASYDELTARERQQHGEPFVLDEGFFYKLLGASEPEHIGAVQHLGRRFRALTTTHLSLRPYAVPLLRSLRELEYRLAIVSNTEATVTSYDLDCLQVREFFDTIVLSSAVGARKPEPRIYEVALDRLETGARNCVFVGDDLECDYLGPRRVGMRSILLCSGRSCEAPCTRPELEPILNAIRSAIATRDHTPAGCLNESGGFLPSES